MSRHGTYDLKYGFIPDDDCPEPKKPQTNADRMRAMTNEEQARFLCKLQRYKEYGQNESADKMCEQLWLDWLKQEATE